LAAEARELVRREIAPAAARLDAEDGVERALVERLAGWGWLGTQVAPAWGGRGMTAAEHGRLCAEVARGSASLQALVTVQDMAAAAIQRWGTDEQRGRWLPALASGRTLAGLAVTEPEVGSDAGGVRAAIAACSDGYEVTGRKRWVSFGRLADVYLVLGRCGDRPTALLVPRAAAGLTVRPVRDQLGLRGAMLADLDLDGCRVPADHRLGPVGAGFSHVVATALDHGRFSVAWSCVGIGQAALAASAAHAAARTQFGAPIGERQLVQRLLAEMACGVRSARLLCLAAARARDERRPSALLETVMAKYVAAREAGRAADAAVQVHGAAGCAPGAEVERLFRDARVMRIIEGTDQVLEVAIGEAVLRRGADALVEAQP
jgi:alkylation response protein AidB-like acyl-CoA dehydrogenase